MHSEWVAFLLVKCSPLRCHIQRIHKWILIYVVYCTPKKIDRSNPKKHPWKTVLFYFLGVAGFIGVFWTISYSVGRILWFIHDLRTWIRIEIRGFNQKGNQELIQSGWLFWNMNFMTFHILGIVIPTEELIFFRWVETTNQLCVVL